MPWTSLVLGLVDPTPHPENVALSWRPSFVPRWTDPQVGEIRSAGQARAARSPGFFAAWSEQVGTDSLEIIFKTRLRRSPKREFPSSGKEGKYWKSILIFPGEESHFVDIVDIIDGFYRD
jgi:hypothetical protein